MKKNYKTIIIPIKHCYGHHLIFPQRFIEFFLQKGISVTFIINKKCEDVLKELTFYRGKNIIFKNFSKVSPFNIKQLLNEINYEKSILFIPTLDEWLADIYLYSKLYNKQLPKIIGILHFIEKETLNIFKKCYYSLIKKGLDLILSNPYNEIFTVADINNNLIKKIPHPIPNFTRNDKGNERKNEVKILIFGRHRNDKEICFFIKNILYINQLLNFNVNLVIAGTFIDKSLGKKVISLYNSLENKTLVTLIEKYLSDQEKENLFCSCDILLLPYKPQNFKDGMISGVLFDALAYNIPVMYTSALKNFVPEGLGVEFDLYNLNDFIRNLNLIVTNYKIYLKNIKKYKDYKEQEFCYALNNIFDN